MAREDRAEGQKLSAGIGGKALLSQGMVCVCVHNLAEFEKESKVEWRAPPDRVAGTICRDEMPRKMIRAAEESPTEDALGLPSLTPEHGIRDALWFALSRRRCL
jgi:hypothetical protein